MVHLSNGPDVPGNEYVFQILTNSPVLQHALNMSNYNRFESSVAALDSNNALDLVRVPWLWLLSWARGLASQ